MRTTGRSPCRTALFRSSSTREKRDPHKRWKRHYQNRVIDRLFHPRPDQTRSLRSATRRRASMTRPPTTNISRRGRNERIFGAVYCRRHGRSLTRGSQPRTDAEAKSQGRRDDHGVGLADAPALSAHADPRNRPRGHRQNVPWVPGDGRRKRILAHVCCRAPCDLPARSGSLQS